MSNKDGSTVEKKVQNLVTYQKVSQFLATPDVVKLLQEFPDTRRTPDKLAKFRNYLGTSVNINDKKFESFHKDRDTIFGNLKNKSGTFDGVHPNLAINGRQGTNADLQSQEIDEGVIPKEQRNNKSSKFKREYLDIGEIQIQERGSRSESTDSDEKAKFEEEKLLMGDPTLYAPGALR